MKVMVLSDLHHDFWALDKRDPFEGSEELMASLDALVLAGDVSNKPKVRWKYAFAHLARHVDPAKTYVFPGNHDFYDFRLLDEERLAAYAEDAGVSYAQKMVLEFETTRMLCATLWTDMELGGDRDINEANCGRVMNDYRYIRLGNGHFRRTMPDDMVRVHRSHRAWLEAELAKPHAGQTVVCTHHAPHPAVLKAYAEGVDAAYASDLEDLMSDPKTAPDAWFFGHVHHGQSLSVKSTSLHNVSLGYPDQVPDPAARLKTMVFDL